MSRIWQMNELNGLFIKRVINGNRHIKKRGVWRRRGSPA